MSKPTTKISRKMHYFMVAAMSTYEREGALKTRHLNVLAAAETQNLTKKDLDSVHRTILQRLTNENGVAPDQLKDTVLISISHLGYMTEKTFMNK